MRLFGYTPERGAAAGDTMPFFHAGKWHLFFSQPPVDAWEYVERARVSTAYIRSDDLVNWEVMPDAFGPGEHGECDGDGTNEKIPLTLSIFLPLIILSIINFISIIKLNEK